MRVADRGTMIAIVMLAAVAAFVLAAPALAAPPAGSQGLGPDGNPGQGHAYGRAVKPGGRHGLTMHSVDSSMPWVEMVSGRIAVISGSRIGMDGENFDLGNARIRTTEGHTLIPERLYIGLDVSLTLEHGVVKSVLVDGYVEPRIVTDPGEIERLRAPMLRERTAPQGR